MISEIEKAKIQSLMHHDDKELKAQYKARKSAFDVVSVLHSEAGYYLDLGYVETKRSARKVTLQRNKPIGAYYEDRVWCMFYELGFRTINFNDNFKVQWGPNACDTQQLDVVAVNDEAIFVVECKASAKPTLKSFKTELNVMELYREGVAKTLQEVFGEEKRVKFIFATENYRFPEDSEDLQRLQNAGIYHMNENSFTYLQNLIKAYRTSSIYQFMGLMFKDELVSNEAITIPALKGVMGEQEYFTFSIHPATLLKIGFVLHRTKVNDSMAPTYQRLLVPKRLKGITEFINKGGFFPNSIIINFHAEKENLGVKFKALTGNVGSAQLGMLSIPNAYAIAFIIDGQHRVYGYAGSSKKDTDHIPVVAFNEMPSEEQLHIFMDINEKQKAVSPSLRLDLEEDLYWDAERLDSRMKALRSSVIKMLSANSNYVLFNKISVGEDSAELAFKPFDTALSKSGLVPKAKMTQWQGDTSTCLYDVNETMKEKAMKEARRRITQYVNGAYAILESAMDEPTKQDFLFSNRATYAVVVLAGSLHAFLCSTLNHTVHTPMAEQINALRPYLEKLAESLNNLPDEKRCIIKGTLGQGADTQYLRTYQSLINEHFPEYAPEELEVWKEMQDQTLQAEGKEYKQKIRNCVQHLVFDCLKKVYGEQWERKLALVKHQCEQRAIERYQDDEQFQLSDIDWTSYLYVSDLRKIVDENFAHAEFSEVFGIDINNTKKKSKKDLLSWFKLIEEPAGKRPQSLTKNDVNCLSLLYMRLNVL